MGFYPANLLRNKYFKLSKMLDSIAVIGYLSSVTRRGFPGRKLKSLSHGLSVELSFSEVLAYGGIELVYGA